MSMLKIKISLIIWLCITLKMIGNLISKVVASINKNYTERTHTFYDGKTNQNEHPWRFHVCDYHQWTISINAVDVRMKLYSTQPFSIILFI